MKVLHELADLIHDMQVSDFFFFSQIRESIRALFPDRNCFTLVRPLNDEHDLQRLDQIPVRKARVPLEAAT